MKNTVKFLSIVLCTTALRIVIQMFHGPDPLSDVLEYSRLVEAFGMPAIAGPMIFLSYFLMSLIFIGIQKDLPGTKISKGLVYGSLFSLLWFHGMVEGHVELDAGLIKEAVFGLCETLPILFLSVLTAVFFGSDNTGSRLNTEELVRVVGAISVFFVIGRYFGYAVIGIHSVYLEKYVLSFLWAMGNGIIIGLMYWALHHGIQRFSPFIKAVLFSVVIFGTDWAMFNLFAPMLFSFSFGEIFLRVGVDICSVLSGIWFIELRLKNRSTISPATVS